MSGESPYFSGDGYQNHLELPKRDKNSTGEKSPAEKAFETANDCRKFETDFFWQRGTYYWAFILASFTANFTCLGKFIDGKSICFNEIKTLPVFSLLILAVTAFFCFFFSWSWVIVNKGSRFWQKNWEKHIDALEKETVGHLFNVVMNEHNTKNCSPSVFSCKPYRYSLAKSTQMTGIVLMSASFLMFGFYVFLLVQKFVLSPWIALAVTVVILLPVIGWLLYLLRSVYPKPPKNGLGRKSADWYMA